MQKVLVIDYGAQYAHLIARRVRECRILSEIVPHDTSLDAIARARPAAIVLSGGPDSVHAPGAPDVDASLFDLGVPVLGICYGQQAMAKALGGRVARTGVAEFGPADLDVSTTRSILFADLPRTGSVWMSHNDAVVEPPPGAFDNQPHRAYNVVPNALLMNFKAVQFQFYADPANGRVRIVALVRTVDDLDNVFVVPRLAGGGSLTWDSHVQAALIGLSRHSRDELWNPGAVIKNARIAKPTAHVEAGGS
jgi:GMP synthase (glutamine-hydrolysing) A subunit